VLSFTKEELRLVDGCGPKRAALIYKHMPLGTCPLSISMDSPVHRHMHIIYKLIESRGLDAMHYDRAELERQRVKKKPESGRSRQSKK
jgi:hypothetical protein